MYYKTSFNRWLIVIDESWKRPEGMGMQPLWEEGQKGPGRKYRVPADRVPYRCTLCKFRSQDPDTLQKHNYCLFKAHGRGATWVETQLSPDTQEVHQSQVNHWGWLVSASIGGAQGYWSFGINELLNFCNIPNLELQIYCFNSLEEEDPFPDWLTGPKMKTPEYVPTSKALLSHTEPSLVDWIQPENQMTRTQDPFLAQRLPRHEDVLHTPKSRSQYLIPRECVHTPKCWCPQHSANDGGPARSLLLRAEPVNTCATSPCSASRTFRDDSGVTDDRARKGGDRNADNHRWPRSWKSGRRGLSRHLTRQSSRHPAVRGPSRT